MKHRPTQRLVNRTDPPQHPPPPSLFDPPPPDRSIEGKFRAFHAHHPEVYVELVRLARRAKERGAERIGIGALWEVLRWNMTVETSGDYRLNNVYRSRYARLIVAQEPDLADMFELRELKSA